MNTVDLVVARYNESVQWLNKVSPDRLFLYNKGNHIDKPYIKLKNFGRESDTILTHIISNYNDLADITIFLQGNPFDHFPSILKILTFANDIEILGTNVLKECSSNRLAHCDGSIVTLGNMFRFSLKDCLWKWDFIWIPHMFQIFNILFGTPAIPIFVESTWGGQFALTRSAIHKFSLQQYIAIKKIHDKNEYLAWGFEKYWCYFYTRDCKTFLKDSKHIKSLYLL